MSSSHVCTILLIALGFLQGVAAWCQASPGSCVGELRSLEKHEISWFGTNASGKEEYEPFLNTSKDLLRFVDWDGDGDVDFLLGAYLHNSFHIQFHERISDHSFRMHELVTLSGFHRKRAISKDWYFFHPEAIFDEEDMVAEAYRSNSSTVEGFQVADWDGDGSLDLLLWMQGPTATNITFLNRALFPVNSIENGSLILSASSVRQDTLCDMQPADFDEDGVVDLFLGGFTRYFRRESTDSDLIEEMNPLEIYNGSVLQVFDFDADGHLELLLDAFGPNDHFETVAFRWLRRALDGSFVESEENPFVDVRLRNQGEISSTYSYLGIEEMYLTDWNSDGLPDIVLLDFREHSRWSRGQAFQKSELRWHARWYQQVRDGDMTYNSHLTVFDEIRVSSFDNVISVLDWNQDGFDDHVDIGDHKQLYEITDAGAKPGPRKPIEDKYGYSFVDWDGDGDLDLLKRITYSEQTSGIASWKVGIRYWEQVDGRFRRAADLDIVSDIDSVEILPVDWDQDGDMDLVLVEIYWGPHQAHYFERLPNGSLQEKQQHPFDGILSNQSDYSTQDLFIRSVHFLDCDGDGDLDVLRVGHHRYARTRVQACEHDKDAGTLTCSNEFLCLGTNLSNFGRGGGGAFERFGGLMNLDLFNVSDGRLQFAAIHEDKPHPVLWTAGSCVPSSSCHGKGFCKEKHQHCTCQKGHELQDCSQCERNFHGVFRDVWQVRECKPCPESDGRLCHGRGECFDDAQAPRDSTALLVAGNGSCRCHEAYFNGTDADDRNTCSEGSCPAGSEERDGRCHPCDGGSFSVAGGSCTPCRSGSYSSPGSSNCSECQPGKVAKLSGASACDECPAGKYENNLQSCIDCPVGFASLGGNSSCRKCPAGSIAARQGSSTCEPCPGGTYSPSGSSTCQKCFPGKFSATGSSCQECPPGTIAEVEGSSTCELCPAGTEESSRQYCRPCRSGLVSSGGNSSCSKCPAGSIAARPGSSTCEPCPGGTYSDPGSSTCQKCFAGKFSLAGSSCQECPPGAIAAMKGSSTCELCPAGTKEVDHRLCEQCPAGSIVSNFSCTKCPAGFVAPTQGLFACEPCQAGFYSGEGSSSCLPCHSGSVSDPASSSCRQCNADLIFFRGVPDELNQSCKVDSIEILLMALSAVAATCFCFSCLTGFHGRIAIADVSTQGQKLVMTANLSHFLLKHSPKVTFKGTENPSLDNSTWKVQKLNSLQLTLHGSRLNQADTSMGQLIFQWPWAFLHTGLLHCPLLLWCLLFGAASAAAMTRLTQSSMLVAIALGICAGSLAFTWQCRLSHRTPISKRRRQFLKEWPLPRQPCERGPDRSMTAGQLHDFVQFFEAFIKERSMYYVSSDIVKPLTKPFQLSFVELIGPSSMEWFVSHYWGMTVRHFNEAIRKHATSYANDWRQLAYWICTFSNSQWHVTNELGNGRWQDSSFYLALSSPSCRGTAMVIDEQVLPLQRIWCLFEVYHTILLSQNDDFQGLLLCTSTGVLQEGRAGTDVAVRVAERVRELDTRTAQASNQEDLRMIHALIERMDGGFDAMNGFVRDTICRALARSHEQYELTFQGLISDLASQGVSARAEASTEQAQGPLPTLLPVRRTADFASFPKGQESPRDIYPMP